MPPEEELFTDTCICKIEDKAPKDAPGAVIRSNKLEIVPNNDLNALIYKSSGFDDYTINFDIAFSSPLINNYINKINNQNVANKDCPDNTIDTPLIQGIELFIYDKETSEFIDISNINLLTTPKALESKDDIKNLVPSYTYIVSRFYNSPILWGGFIGDDSKAKIGEASLKFPFINDGNNKQKYQGFKLDNENDRAKTIVELRKLNYIEEPTITYLNKEQIPEDSWIGKDIEFSIGNVTSAMHCYFVDEDVYYENKDNLNKFVPPGVHPYIQDPKAIQLIGDSNDPTRSPAYRQTCELYYPYTGAIAIDLYGTRSIGQQKALGLPGTPIRTGEGIFQQLPIGGRAGLSWTTPDGKEIPALRLVRKRNTALLSKKQGSDNGELTQQAPRPNPNLDPTPDEPLALGRYKNQSWIVGWPRGGRANLEALHENNTSICQLLRNLEKLKLSIQNNTFDDKYSVYIEFKYDTFTKTVTNKMVDPDGNDEPYRVYLNTSKFNIYDGNSDADPKPIIGKNNLVLEMRFDDDENTTQKQYESRQIEIPSVMFFDIEANTEEKDILNYISAQYGENFGQVKSLPSNKFANLKLDEPYFGYLCDRDDDITNPNATLPDLYGSTLSTRSLVQTCPRNTEEKKDKLDKLLKDKALSLTYRPILVFPENPGICTLGSSKSLKDIAKYLVANRTDEQKKNNSAPILYGVLLNTKESPALVVQGGNDPINGLSNEKVYFIRDNRQLKERFPGATGVEFFDINSLLEVKDKWFDAGADRAFRIWDFKLSESEDIDIIAEAAGDIVKYNNLKKEKLLTKSDTIRVPFTMEFIKNNGNETKVDYVKISTNIDITYPILGITNKEQLNELFTSGQTIKIGDFIREIVRISDIDKKIKTPGYLKNLPDSTLLRLYFYNSNLFNEENLRIYDTPSEFILKTIDTIIKKDSNAYVGPKGNEVFVIYSGTILGKDGQKFDANSPLMKELKRLESVPCRSKVEEKRDELLAKRDAYIEQFIRPLEDIRDNYFFSYKVKTDLNNITIVDLNDCAYCDENGPGVENKNSGNRGIQVDITNTTIVNKLKTCGIGISGITYEDGEPALVTIDRELLTSNVIRFDNVYFKCNNFYYDAIVKKRTTEENNDDNSKFNIIFGEPFELPRQFIVRKNNLLAGCGSNSDVMKNLLKIYGLYGDIRSYGYVDKEYEYIMKGVSLTNGKIVKIKEGKKFDNIGYCVCAGAYDMSNDRIIDSNGKAEFLIPQREGISLGDYLAEWNTKDAMYSPNVASSSDTGGIESLLIVDNENKKYKREISLCYLIYMLYTERSASTITQTVRAFKDVHKAKIQKIFAAADAIIGKDQVAVDTKPGLQLLLDYIGPSGKTRTIASLNDEIAKLNRLLNEDGLVKEICGPGTLGADIKGNIYDTLLKDDSSDSGQFTE